MIEASKQYTMADVDSNAPYELQKVYNCSLITAKKYTELYVAMLNGTGSSQIKSQADIEKMLGLECDWQKLEEIVRNNFLERMARFMLIGRFGG